MGTSRLSNLFCGVATAAVISYFSLSRPYFIPQEMEYFDEKATSQMSETYDINPYYYIDRSDSVVFNQVDIIHKFVSELLENTQDLDSHFSELVDKHFWDLV